MKVRWTISGTYEIPNDPEAREKAYGTADVVECLAIDRQADPEFLLQLSEDTTLEIELA